MGAKHLKNKKVQPDEQKFKEKEKKIKDNINEHKLRLAMLKHEQDTLRGKTEVLRKKQETMKSYLEEANTTLKERKQESAKVHQKLVQELGMERGLPRRIKDPEKKLKNYEAERDHEKQRLRMDDLTTGEEKKCMRNIKILENNIAEVKKYIDQNIDSVFVQKEQHQSAVNDFRKTHQEKYDMYSSAKSEADEEFANLSQNIDSQKEIQKDIQNLQQRVEESAKKYDREWDDWQKWTRNERELKMAMNAKQYDEELKAVSFSVKKKSDSKSSETKKEASKEEAKREKAVESLQSVESRRKAAVEAYERIQSKLKKKVTSAPVGGETANVVNDVSMEKDDPHAAEKDLCRTLIAYCQSNMPSTQD